MATAPLAAVACFMGSCMAARVVGRSSRDVRKGDRGELGLESSRLRQAVSFSLRCPLGKRGSG
eukprot:8440852-Prorocentrum_lima.AAC.1